LSKCMRNFYRVKSSLQVWDPSVIFKNHHGQIKRPMAKHSPNLVPLLPTLILNKMKPGWSLNK
jgi:hypothetical protein